MCRLPGSTLAGSWTGEWSQNSNPSTAMSDARIPNNTLTLPDDSLRQLPRSSPVLLPSFRTSGPGPPLTSLLSSWMDQPWKRTVLKGSVSSFAWAVCPPPSPLQACRNLRADSRSKKNTRKDRTGWRLQPRKSCPHLPSRNILIKHTSRVTSAVPGPHPGWLRECAHMCESM